MKLFLTDLWHDLREKRLWPVAAGLLVAIVAVPVLLSSGGSGGGGAPAVAPAKRADLPKGPAVTLVRDGVGGDSDLSRFKAKDPFHAPRSAAPGQPQEQPAGSDGSKGGGSSSTPILPDLPQFGGSGDAGTGGGSGDAGTGGDRPKKKAVSYAWVVDVRFGRRDGTPRPYSDLERLDVLPRSGDPLIMFLGVSPTGKSAVFLVDSGLDQHGDGRCQPSREQCTFLHLTLERGHDLHFFRTGEGLEYSLRLVDIRKVRTDELRRARASRARAARRAQARGSRSGRRSAHPVLGADEVLQR